MCGLAGSGLMLNIARLVQGVGAAMMLSASLPLLTDTFEGRERAQAFGIWGIVVGAGAALGPFLGGLIVSTWGWRWAFLVNVPVTIAMVALTLAVARESRDPNAKQLDLGGIAAFTAACFALIYPLINGTDHGWTSVPIVCSFVSAIVLFTAFAFIERAQKYPMLDLSLLTHPPFLGASLPPLATSIAFWGPFLYFPLYYQVVLGYSPLQAGLASLPFAIPLLGMGVVGGKLAQRIPSHVQLPGGLALIAVGLAWLTLPGYGAVWTA